jgi:L-histidine Nalpha-methyltransferase
VPAVIVDLHPDVADFRTEILAGLSGLKKSISPKYFYDETGARLFEEITALPEYYPTRIETAILHQYAPRIAELLPAGSLLIELGSGSSTKTRIVLDAAHSLSAYMPVDLSREQLQESAEEIARLYPRLEVVAVCADYMNLAEIPESAGYSRHAIFFPGSTIGNLQPDEAEAFLRAISWLLRPGDHVIVGVDLKKEKAILDAAYDDARGVTAAFNLNLLARINRELGGDFDLEAFEHVAFYDESLGRIEMHLRSRRSQFVTVASHTFGFGEGEMIHTENSYKYSCDEFAAMARASGLDPVECWTDDEQMFSVHLLSVK